MPRFARRSARGTAAVVAVAAAAALTSCAGAGEAGGEGGDDGEGRVLTYWASQQSPSVERDEEILAPELEKFTAETGIEVELEVIPFSELLNKILTATTSGQGPDVINIGNTWSASLQATGALVEWDDAMMDQLGGADRFVPAALETAGAEGSTPAAVPLYNKVFQLYYNKALFDEAGIDGPPSTWDEFTETARQLTKDTDGDGAVDQWGLGLRGQAGTTAAHYAFILGSARGAEFYDDGSPTFDTTAAVEGIDQYLSWLGEEEIVNPSDAENADWADVYTAFAEGEAAMMLVQTLGQTLKDYGLTDADYGVAPMPSPEPGDGPDVASFVGGTNVAIFASSEEQEAAVELVAFLTSAEEQSVLNAAYGTIPAVTDVTGDAFDTPEMQIARQTLAERAVPMPRVPSEAQFETLVGADVVGWLARTATGDRPTPEEISAALAAAEQKVSAGG